MKTALRLYLLVAIQSALLTAVPELVCAQDAPPDGDSYMGLNGEELWSNNCMRCHNIRPPSMYSDAQWDVIVHHMRRRANITGQEQRAIVEFLKSAK
jgi:hypothetical protein